MSNLEKIRNMNADDMADYIYNNDDNLNDKICKQSHEECPFGDNLTPDNCKNCIKKWLESEVEGE